MRVVGLDLAGSERNTTGFCIFEESGEKVVSTMLLHTDEEIVSGLKNACPDLIAVDAPLDFAGTDRECDIALRKYGVLPPTMHGMRTLAVRGTALAKKIRECQLEYVEVSVRASSKILGLNSKDDFVVQKRLMGLDLGGDITKRILSRDELDSVCAAVTGALHLLGESEVIANQVVIPRV
ncbi:MAG: DUF429 domain-containing protein [Candidatus Altiarchaeota archaeon]|nr:DUF429 domain-containing protein [Candidatus Altiarchaeota archaeon]